jgi:3-dehydroquinate dehydratase type I
LIGVKKPRICAVITGNRLEALEKSEPLVDFFEVRIDLIGNGWEKLVKRLNKPWIACNRRVDEGGSWRGDDTKRAAELLRAVELGADMVDLELRTKGLEKVAEEIKGRAKCLLSFHDLKRTPPLEELKRIVRQQREAGADICKVVTTAQRAEDNLTVLQLTFELKDVKRVSFAIGPLGLASRILSPLVGGDFTYASLEKGKESAPGQLTVSEMRKIYEMINVG